MNVVLIVITVLIVLIVVAIVFTAWVKRQAEMQAPPIGQFIDMDGARLHYVDRGTGPAIVMVHGLSGNLRNFFALVDQLSTRYRIIAVDRPGCGYSTTQSSTQPSLRTQASLVAGLIRQLKLDRPLLVGHSLGGALSLALASQNPDCVRALALISTASQMQEKPPRAFKVLDIRSATLRRVVAWTLMAPLGKLSHDATLKAVFAPDPASPDFDIEGGGILGLRPESFMAACQDMLGVPDELAAISSHYPSLTLPVEVIFGRQDPILNYRVHGQDLVAALPNAALQLVDGGHMLPVTHVEEVIACIERAAARA